MIDVIGQERENERWRAIFEIEQRQADHRAGTIAAMVLNSQRASEDAKVWTSEDFFPWIARKDDVKQEVESDATPREEGLEPGMMSTAQTVQFVRSGFGLFVPRH